MDRDWMVLLEQKNQLGRILETNRAAARFGLELTEQDGERILEERRRALREQRRIEFGEGIVPKIIYEFCDSDYVEQGNYVETIIRLQDIFYLYKNEMRDEITDDELLHLMREQFEFLCFGDLDYLESTCLADFAQAVRAGYGGYAGTDGKGEYGRFDGRKRWDYELYLETLKKLCQGE